MQVTETLNDGLKREIKITVPAKDLDEKLTKRLDEAKGKVRLNGFRPGKVPAVHLRKTYGRSFMAEVINEILNETPPALLRERGERSATQPQIDMGEDEKEMEKILAGGCDFSFTLNYEILPKIELKACDSITVTREIADVGEKEVEERVTLVLASNRSYTPKEEGASEENDRVTIDYVGKIDGEAFEHGSAEGADLVLGSKSFIPGFEEQLIGVKTGEEKTITITFPEDYGASQLAGKEASFDIKVHAVARPDEVVLDDNAAKKIGIESLDRLRTVVREQIESQYGAITRQKVKRQILDALDNDYQFEAPSRLIDAEFNNIWNQITRDLAAENRTFEDEGTTEEAAREEYRKLAERRVRLGLVLSEMGEKAGISVSEEEMQRAVYEQVRRFPGQEKELLNFFRSSPDALAGLRAPIFEEKVIDHLLTLIKITDKTVTPEELSQEEEETIVSRIEAAQAATAVQPNDADDVATASGEEADKPEDATA